MFDGFLTDCLNVYHVPPKSLQFYALEYVQTLAFSLSCLPPDTLEQDAAWIYEDPALGRLLDYFRKNKALHGVLYPPAPEKHQTGGKALPRAAGKQFLLLAPLQAGPVPAPHLGRLEGPGGHCEGMKRNKQSGKKPGCFLCNKMCYNPFISAHLPMSGANRLEHRRSGRELQCSDKNL